MTVCHAFLPMLRAQEQYDLDVPLDARAQKLIDAAGAGRSFTSPGWLTELGRLWGGKSVRHLKPNPCTIIKDCCATQRLSQRGTSVPYPKSQSQRRGVAP